LALGVANCDALKLRLLSYPPSPPADFVHDLNPAVFCLEADREGHCALDFCILDVFKFNAALFLALI
jgi:hypothetical protein